MGLAFTTDRTIAPSLVTWHGQLHDLSFVGLGLLLVPAMIMLALAFRELEGWRQQSPFTWITVALAIPTFAVKGIIFYAFLGAMLTWSEVIAAQLWK
jgi:hypothetical protein